jgi:hypothetical protein
MKNPSYAIINKTKVILLQSLVTLGDLAIPFMLLGFIPPKTFNYLAVQSFDFERFQKRALLTKLRNVFLQRFCG